MLGTLISCNPNIELSKIVPTEVDQFARTFITDIQQNQIDECLTKVAENMQNEEGRTFMSNIASGISSLQLDSLNMINGRYTSFMGDNPTTNYIVEYEQELDEQSIYFFFNILKEGNKLTVTGFDARWMEAPLSKIHAFTFSGKPAINYIFFILAIASVGFVIFTLVAAIRTPMKRKWLWIIGILFTFIKFKLNWTTSEFDFQLISFQLLGAGFSKSGLVAPWFLTFSVPVFAIAFWIKKFQKEKEQAQDEKMANIIAQHSKNEEGKGA
ncbi:hypothetical protein SAMN05444394_0889 [Algoriphagus halophilus]|uniref:Uncharacterized protein n=2 Tax=Algoriphagus halophilus TaxID=226505 RepID=A0A1N6DH42_9BACT|nr:hypothetical protein SAMN05444394_0889 [Algoriphagus halophilus]